MKGSKSKKTSKKSQLTPADVKSWQLTRAKWLSIPRKDRPTYAVIAAEMTDPKGRKGIDPSNVGGMLTGTNAIHFRAAPVFARFFKCDVAEIRPDFPPELRLGLVKGVTNMKPRYAVERVPVRWIARFDQDGHWKRPQHPAQTGNGFINMPSSDKNSFAIRIFGDSRSRVRSGEYVVVEPDHSLIVTEEVLITKKDGTILIRDFLYQRDGELAVQDNRGERLILPDSEIESVHYVAAICKQALWSGE